MKKGERKLTRPEGLIFDEQDRKLIESHTICLRSDGYPILCIGRTYIRLNRAILDSPKNLDVDHINGNLLDCTRMNLRSVPHAHNSQNRTKNDRRNSSGYRGVTWDKRINKWKSQAKMNGITFNLGSFDNLFEAAELSHGWRLQNMPGYIASNDPYFCFFTSELDSFADYERASQQPN